MYRKNKMTILFLLPAFLLVFFNIHFLIGATSEAKEIQILATSDIHNTFYPYDYATDSVYENGSIAKVASVIATHRTANTILIDNGDTLQGPNTTLFQEETVSPMIAAMNALKYDIWTSGNHEYNYGVEQLEKEVASFQGSFLAANVYKGNPQENQRVADAQAYKVIERDGVRVAIIGVVTPNIINWDRDNLQGYTVTDPLIEVQKAVQNINTNRAADLIIVSFHASLNGEYAGATDAVKKIGEQVDGIDALIAGHEHAVIDEEIQGVSKKIPVLEPGKHGEYVSQFKFKLTKTEDGFEIANPQSDVVAQNIATKNYDADAAMLNLLTPYHEKALNYAHEVIGELKTESLVPEAEVLGITQAQIQDTALLDLILDVQKKAVEEKITIPDRVHHITGAAIFDAKANIHPGLITRAATSNIYRYDNTLMTLKITGADLKRYMEWSAEYYNQYEVGDLTISFDEKIRMYNYDMLGGVDYQIDISQGKGKRIKSLVYSNTKLPVENTDEIYLTVNNYRANTHLMNGLLQDDYEVVYNSSTETSGTVRDKITEYITKIKTIEPNVDNNWKIIGNSWNSKFHEIAKTLINRKEIIIPQSTDGRTPNIKSITIQDVDAVTSSIDLLSVNDFHGAVIESGKNIGAAKFATVIKEKRTQNPDTIFLGSGDLFQGSAISNLTKGEIVADVFEELQMEYSALGNHEFDWGVDEIPKFSQKGNFTFLAANIVEKNSEQAPSWAKPYAVIEKNGKKIGMIGLITPSTAYQTVPENVKDFTFLEPVDVTKKWEQHLRTVEGVDTVLVLSHLSSDQNAAGEVIGEGAELAKAVPSLDGIFTAHSHKFVNGEIEGVPIVQGGYNGRGLAELKVIYDNSGKKLGVIPNVEILSDKSTTIQPDKETQTIITKFEKELEPILNEVIGINMQELPHESQQKQPITPMGQVTAKLMRDIAQTQIAIINGGGIRSGLDAGEITMAEMYTIFPFDNTLVTLEVKGSDLKKILEHGIASQGFRPGQFYGLNVYYETDEQGMPKISSMWTLDGIKIEMNQYYSVATIDFLLSGGDKYDFSQARNIQDTGLPLRDKLAEHIKKNKNIVHRYEQSLIEEKDEGALIDSVEIAIKEMTITKTQLEQQNNQGTLATYILEQSDAKVINKKTQEFLAQPNVTIPIVNFDDLKVGDVLAIELSYDLASKQPIPAFFAKGETSIRMNKVSSTTKLTRTVNIPIVANTDEAIVSIIANQGQQILVQTGENEGYLLLIGATLLFISLYLLRKQTID